MPLDWALQENGDFECRILAASHYTPAVLNMKEVAGYATSDVFVRLPTKPHLWRM
ncbi:hypothetical protein BDN72DRAFT_906376 [Pluteus cervinus]|uniref:Uncharacterized protein n=1 Tax=Pluteus cervinus TaxID=181527 RepID=A0ACD2ZZE7_9AGAR|nr:hypothetical protein BDN72DRAFT_906376 [Pluteus cervinus]